MERNRISIPIRGIDRSASDDTVPDGACEDMLNFRYRAGSFETVCEPQLLHPVLDWAGFNVVIRLDDMSADEYVARHGNEVCRVRIAAGGVAEQEKIMTLPDGASEVGYSRFGRMLYVNYTLDGELQEEIYYYKDGRFSRVDFSAITPPQIWISTETLSAPQKNIPMTEGTTGSVIPIATTAVELAYVEYHSYYTENNQEEYYYNAGVQTLNDQGYTTGMVFLFAAYQLFDGTVVKPGPICQIAASDIGGSLFQYISAFEGEGREGTVTKCTFYGQMGGFKATIRVDIPEEVRDNELIKNVVLFSTRNIPIHEFDNIFKKFGKEGFPVETIAGGGREVVGLYRCDHACVANPELDEELGTMYELAEIEFREDQTSIKLTYKEHFQHIENQPVYKPNFSCHHTVSAKKYEYNERLHIYDLTTQLFGGYKLVRDDTNTIVSDVRKFHGGTVRYIVDVSLTVDASSYRIRSSIDGGYWTVYSYRKDEEPVDCLLLPEVLSYPDARATQIEIWAIKDGTVILYRSYMLDQSLANNYASKRLEQYQFSLPLDPVENATIPPSDEKWKIYQANKIQVSYPSNPFVYAPANIYTVGGSGERIQQIIATAERMTEAVYGYQPLLTFTDRAVYALESGEGEVLYARNIPILSRTILEGTNAVEGDGAVFFASTSGITAIVRGQITAISEAMKRYAGLCPQDDTLPDFDDYIRSVRLMFNRKESELIVYNPTYSYAYIYSLAGQEWTRRAWDGAVEPYFNEVATADGVASLSEEDPARPVSACRLITRPLKLGSFEYKRLETLVARMRCGGSTSFELSIEGSDDAVHWTVLRSERNVPAIRRTPSSFRYHRVVLVRSVGDYLAITHFDVEFYNRFVRRLR